MKIAIVVGTRPEIIKMAPIIQESLEASQTWPLKTEMLSTAWAVS